MTLELLFEGRSYSNWLEYSVDADLRRPASAFSLRVRNPETAPPITPGGLTELRVDGNTVLWGRVDTVTTRRSATGLEVSLHGRDAGALLVDAAADHTWRWTQATLEQIAATVCNYVGFVRAPNVEYSPTVRRVRVEPGERCWALLERLAQAEGLRLWVDGDGRLQISQYRTADASVGRLVARRDGRDVNVVESSVRRSCLDSWSQVTVLGQWDDRSATRRLAAEHVDLSAPYFKPEVREEEVRGTSEAKAKAEEAVTRAAGRRLELEYTVRGHVDAEGLPWTLNSLVDLEDAYEELADQYLVIGTRFTRTVGDGTRTVLTLAEPGVFRG